MNASSDSTLQRVRDAMKAPRPDDIIGGVKHAVSDALSALNPDAKVEPTPYFNHTYMPDFVVVWRAGTKEQQRPVFLRNELRARSAALDVDELSTRDPVILGLEPAETNGAQFGDLRERARGANSVLVSDLSSLAQVTPDASSDNLAGSNSLARLVGANLLTGGRGLVLGEEAARLNSATRQLTDPESDSPDEVASFEAAARAMFAEDAALRLVRTAELLRFGFNDEQDLPVSLTTGELTIAELRTLLPALLADPRARQKDAVWRYLAGLMNLGLLEDMGDVLADVDVTPLVVQAVGSWTGRRSQLALNSAFDAEAADADEGWTVRSRTLSAARGRWRVHVTSDSRRLRGRDDSHPAQWDDLKPKLEGFAIDAIDLRGVARRVTIRAEESGDVARDVTSVRASLDDAFHVREITVRRVGDEDSAGIDVDFSEMTATAAQGAPLRSLVLAAGLLAYRDEHTLADLVDDISDTPASD